MKTNLEKLNVPYIEAIHGSDADDVINKLEELGERRTIDSIGWKNEFPYHPLTTFSVAHSDKSLYIDFFVRSNYLRAMRPIPRYMKTLPSASFFSRIPVLLHITHSCSTVSVL